MTEEQEIQASEADEGSVRGVEAENKSHVVPSAHGAPDRQEGLERIREILLGDIVAELERKLARLDRAIVNRSGELKQDVRRRTDVLEGHVRKELQSLSARATHDNSEVNGAILALRLAQREAFAQIEQRLARIEDRVEGSPARIERETRDAFVQIEQRIGRVEDRVEASIARVERDTREQLLEQAKSHLDELDRIRHQLRDALVRELGLEPTPVEEGVQHDADAWASHH